MRGAVYGCLRGPLGTWIYSSLKEGTMTTETNTNVPAVKTSGRAVDVRRPRETGVDRNKLVVVAGKAGLVPSDMRNFRLTLTSELMVTKAIREATMCYLTHPQLIIKHRGKPPTLDNLLDGDNPLLISVWRREK